MDDVKGYFIKSDGSLWYGMKELTQSDWHAVVNPKRTYYPELDKTSPYYKEKIKDINLNDSYEDPDILEVEIL